jgi:hypothetical protein
MLSSLQQDLRFAFGQRLDSTQRLMTCDGVFDGDRMRPEGFA